MGDAIKDKLVLDYVVYYGSASAGRNIVDDTMSFLKTQTPPVRPGHVMSFAATKLEADSFCDSTGFF